MSGRSELSRRQRDAARSTRRSGTAARRPQAALPRRNVRDEIFLAALACFEQRGVRRTSMDDVAREAGVSRPAIYYYFPDKDALLLEVIVRRGREIHGRIREKVRAKAGIDAILDAAVHSIRMSRDDPYVRLLMEPDTANLTTRIVESDMVQGLRRELWYPLLESARKRGELRADRDFDDLIRWITFLELSMITNGELFDLTTPAVIRAELEAFLAPALRRQQTK